MKNEHEDKHKTVGASFAAEQSAITILRSLLPPTWIIRPQSPDFHIDYLVEITTGGELTGINFGIQLKSWQCRKKNSAPTYPLKTKHLVYFTEKSTFPVFLVRIDIVAQVGYWVFTQRLGDEIGIERLKKQKSVRICFSPNDTLNDLSAFEKSIGTAVRYMRDKHPGSIHAALKNRRKELEAKDDRISVEITATESEQHIIIQPKQDIEFSFSINHADPGTAAKVRDFIENGADLNIKASQLDVKGMPILEEMIKASDKIRMQFSRLIEGHAILAWGKTSSDAHVQLPAKYRPGQEYLTFECELPNAPLKISGSLQTACLSQGGDCSLSFDIVWERWKGVNIAILPYFENLQSLFRAAHANAPMELTLHIQGNRFLRVEPGDLLRPWIEPILLLFDAIDKARRIAQKCQVAVRLPDFEKPGVVDLFTENDELFALMFQGVHMARTVSGKLTLSIKPTQPPHPTPQTGSLMIVHQKQYDLWGTPINVGLVQEQFTNMRLISEMPKTGGRIELTFEPMGNSLRILRKGDEMPLTSTTGDQLPI